MKKNKIIALLFLIITFTGCEDKLDLAPISELTTANYYKTEAHMEAAVVGMYNGIRDLYTINKPWICQPPSDNISLIDLFYDEGERGITQYKTTTNNSVVLDYWEVAYQAIYRCNILIEKSEEADFLTDAIKARYIAEGKFVRALIYFDMVRLFGGVPLITSILPVEDTYTVGRASDAEMWSQIKSDLVDAVGVLPADDYSGRATKYSALGILADVHLNLAEYSDAKTAVDQVINSGKFELFDDFAEVYKDANNNGKHSIFAIQFLNQTGEGNSYPTRNAPKIISVNEWPFAGGDNELVPSEQLWNAYSTDDLRRDLTMKNTFTNGRDGTVYYDRYWQIKHGINNTPFAANFWGINHIVMRYAEALLISAEVENKLGNKSKAVQLINMIRSRAGLADFSSSDANAIQEEIYLQRRLELAFENERWFDVQRSGKAAQILSTFTTGTPYSYSDTYALFPIPQNEIGKVGADILQQNPGY